MDPDLENVIRQALGDALEAGRDHLSQTELAVRAVQRARPDMTASDALAAVMVLLRFSGELFAHSRPVISNWTGLW